MTWTEAYTSLLNVYKKLMFPESPYKTGWAMTQIDQFDVHAFYELMDTEIVEQEKEVYLSEIW